MPCDPSVHPSGFFPRIVNLALDGHVEGGQAVARAKARGWREVTELPDEYAELRERYRAAIDAWRKERAERAAEVARLHKLGVKVGTMLDVTGTEQVRMSGTSVTR